jgi:TolA-binding protein
MRSVKREEMLRELREESVPWDDLRALRVQRATWKRFLSLRAVKPAERRRSFWVLSGALAAAAILVLWVVGSRVKLWPAPMSETASRVVGDTTSVPKAPATANRTMKFDPGSSGVLTKGADVRILQQTPERFAVGQFGGRVDYDIRHDPKRAFVVHVADVTVAVLGTRFSVELEATTVKVNVESGRVRVSGGGRITEVVTGESVTVQAFHAGMVPGDDATKNLVEEKSDTSPKNGASSAQNVPAQQPLTVEELLAQADAARASGRSDEAARALRTLLSKYPRSPQTRNALFTLARVERSRNNHVAAAQAFARCSAFGGTLAGEAAAEEAASWLAAGRKDNAKRAAERYLRHYPTGAHAAKMRAILE